MKNLVKVHLLTIAVLMMFTSVAYGIQGSSVSPTQIPKGAYANGADGNHVFVQTVYLKLTGTWAIGGTITISFPGDVLLPDVDQDAVPSRIDEPIVTWITTAATTFSVTAASATSIEITSAGAITTAADEVWIIFPITTSATPALSSDDYTVTFGGVATVEGADIDLTVNFADQLDLITWSTLLEDAGASGKVQTNTRGKYLPDSDAAEAANTMVGVTSLPNLIKTAAIADISWTAANVNLWAPTIGGAAMDAVDANDVAYYLWASQVDTLARINSGSGQRVIDYDDTGVLDPKTYPLSYDNLDFLQAAGPVPVAHTGFISAYLLDEGNWYIYVTSDATGDWVVGRSDTLEVRQQPVFADFYDATLGTGLIFDDDVTAGNFDDIYTAGVGLDGELASITLESGGVINIAGAYGPAANEKDISTFWFVEDVDDNAEVHIFRSTSATLTAADIDITVVEGEDVVSSLDGGSAVKIHTTELYEEDADAYYNYQIYTSETVFEPANTYYIYVVLNDGNNQTIKAVDTEAVASAGAPVAATLTIKHYPFFGWHVYKPYDAGGPLPGVAVQYNLESADSRYFTASWGNPPTGSTNKDGDTDIDAAGTATVKIYAITAAAGTWAGIITVDPTNTTALDAAVSAGTATLLTTITDSVDTREANRYEWDYRNSGLAAGTYYVWAIMEHSGDKILAQLNPDGTPGALAADQDDIEIVLSHTGYMRAVSPYAGPPVELDNGDSYRLVWESFDKNTLGSPAVFAALVKVGADNPGNASMVTWANTAPYDASADIVWVLPTSTNGADPATGEAGALAADGSVIINIANLTSTAAGVGAPAEGDYEVYYFYDPDEDGGVPDADWLTNPPNGVKAHGTIYLSAQTTTVYNIRLTPSKMSISPGDTLEVDIYATDDGSAEDPNMAIFFVDIPQASLFEIVDQDGDPDNGVVQPFDNLIGTDPTGNALGGEVLMNSLETIAGSYVLGYLEKLASGVTAPINVPGSKMTSFKIVMSSAIATPIEDLEIVFSESEGFMTNLYDDDGSPQATALPPVALTVRMGQSGILYGAVDVEGRDDQGEEVSFYLVEAGSFTPLADAAYLDANSDADGTDGIQITLGASGYYELEGIPSGEYDVLVRKDGYLDVIRSNQRIVSMDYTAMNFTGGNKLFGGDAAGYDDDGVAATASLPDNRIDGDDTGAIATAFGTSSGDSLWNVYADVDESGEVGINDLFMASKNLGRDADGVFYREIPGSNQDAVIYLAIVDETAEGITFAVQAEKLFNLSAYSVDMFVPADDWEIVSCSDGLASHFETIQASRLGGSIALFGSAAKGYARVADKEVELMTITLRQLSIGSEMPTLSEVALVSSDGTLTRALIGGMRDMVPDEFALNQNYPNPFNPSTIINFALPSEGQVRLTVFNLLGQEVRTLVSGALEPGSYKAVWNSLNNQGEKVGTGIYFYHLVVNNKVIATKKMVLMK